MNYLRLLRSSHIFSAVVREVLEENLIRDTTNLPLTLSQFHLLKLLSIDGQHQVGEVADFLGMSPPAASKNIEKLVRLGLLDRKRSEGDRRALLLSVTSRGRRLVIRYEELKAARLYPLLDQFAPQDIEALAHLLERFILALCGLDTLSDGVCLRCGAYLQDDCVVGVIQGGCPYRSLRARNQREDPEAETQ
ncbi:MAG: MarR family transcriptional regulator [bacterium]